MCFDATSVLIVPPPAQPVQPARSRLQIPGTTTAASQRTAHRAPRTAHRAPRTAHRELLNDG